jgi:hypothetical protein
VLHHGTLPPASEQRELVVFAFPHVPLAAHRNHVPDRVDLIGALVDQAAELLEHVDERFGLLPVELAAMAITDIGGQRRRRELVEKGEHVRAHLEDVAVEVVIEKHITHVGEGRKVS